MDVTVKNHVLASKNVTHISFNQKRNLLAYIVLGSDSVQFVIFDAKGQPHHEFEKTARPMSSSKNCMTWSHDGRFLALGSASSVEVWELLGFLIRPSKTFDETFVEINLIEWNYASTVYACGGINSNNSVLIRDITNGQSRELELKVSICCISFDPLGDFIVLLLKNNCLVFYNAGNLQKIHEMCLSPQPISTILKHEYRNMSWSPSYRQLILPSLEEQVCPVSITLSRSTNFHLKDVFYGHNSPISVVKFSPVLYSQSEGETYSILATGDTMAGLAIWKVYADSPAELLLLLTSPLDSQQLIQELEWSVDGLTLYVCLQEPYIQIIRFNSSSFGIALSSQQVQKAICQSSGSSKTFQGPNDFLLKSYANTKNLQISLLGICELSTEMTSKHNPPIAEKGPQLQKQSAKQLLNQNEASKNPLRTEKSVDDLIAPSLSFTGDQNNFVEITSQRTIRQEGRPKKIIPALLAPKGAQEKPTTIIQSLQLNYAPLELDSLRFHQTYVRINQLSWIDILREGSRVVLKLKTAGKESAVIEKAFYGCLSWICCKGCRIYLICDGKLFIFNERLRCLQLPIQIGEIHCFSANLEGSIYYMTTEARIYGFNPFNQVCYTPTPVPLQTLPVPLQKNSLISFNVGQDCNIHIVLRAEGRFMFDYRSRCWVSLGWLYGALLETKDKLVLTAEESLLAKVFFESKIVRQDQPNITAKQHRSLMSEQQGRVLYFHRYSPGSKQHLQSIVSLMNDLYGRGQYSQLRTLVIETKQDNDSPFFLGERFQEILPHLGPQILLELKYFNHLEPYQRKDQ